MKALWIFHLNSFDVNPSTLVGISKKTPSSRLPTKSANSGFVSIFIHMNSNRKKSQLSLQKKVVQEIKVTKNLSPFPIGLGLGTFSNRPWPRVGETSWCFVVTSDLQVPRPRPRWSKLGIQTCPPRPSPSRWIWEMKPPTHLKPLEKPMGFLWGGFWVS